MQWKNDTRNAKETTMTATTTRNELKTAILDELKCRPDSDPAIDLPALVEDYGPEALEVVTELRQAGKVRLVAIGDLHRFSELHGGLTATIQGTGERFGSVHLRGR